MTALKLFFATTAGSHMPSPQRALAITAFLLLLSIVPTALAMASDSRTLLGVNVWLKSLKFQLSFGVHLATVAWLLSTLPAAERSKPLVGAMAAILIGVATFEIAYIAYQALHGAASHYNVATPFTRFMYGLMGVGAVAAVATTGVIGGLILWHGDTRSAFVLAAGLGLVLGSVLGGITGVYMGSQPGHDVGGPATGAAELWFVGWSRVHGDLRVAHFVGLHTMQALPLVALTGSSLGLSRAVNMWLVLAAAIAATCATIVLFIQARLGLPFLPLT